LPFAGVVVRITRQRWVNIDIKLYGFLYELHYASPGTSAIISEFV